MLGLSIAEGKAVLAALQAHLVGDQVNTTAKSFASVHDPGCGLDRRGDDLCAGDLGIDDALQAFRHSSL